MTESAPEPKVIVDGQVPDWLKKAYGKVLVFIDADTEILRLRLSLGMGGTPDQCAVRLWLAAKTVGKAGEAAREVMQTLCGDRQTYIRRAPIAQTERDFETSNVTHSAGARFHILNRRGRIEMLAPGTPGPNDIVGAAK